MSARRVLTTLTVATSLAALIARAVASALADIEHALWTYSVEIPDTVPDALAGKR